MLNQVIKMVTNPKTYLACSLKGLYRKADSFRKDIVHKYTHNLHQSNKGTILTISIIIIEDFQKCDNHHLHIACNCLQWHFSLQPGDFSPLDRCSMKIRCCLIVDRNILLSWNKISRFKHKTILNVNVQPGEVRAAPLVFLLGQPRLPRF